MLIIRVIVAEAIAYQALVAPPMRGPVRKGAIEVDLDDDIAEIKQKRVDPVTHHDAQTSCYDAACRRILAAP